MKSEWRKPDASPNCTSKAGQCCSTTRGTLGVPRPILAAGAQAIATSSWSVAEAQGYRDGEAIPIGLVEQTISRIAATVDAPVTVDFEGGYSEDDDELAGNIARLLDLGVIGINFEDRVVKGTGLYDVARQAERIAAIRETAEERGVKLFINARTDVFFEHGDDAVAAVPEALERAKAYTAARRVRSLRSRAGGRRADRPDRREHLAPGQCHGLGRRAGE